MGKTFVCVFLLLMISVFHVKCDESLDQEVEVTDEVVKEVQLLVNGDQIINSWPRSDYIMVLGEIGSGKSTVIQFLTNTDLMVKKRNYKLEFDDGFTRIGTENNAKFKTFYPEFIRDKITGDIFIDFPGFEDASGNTNPIFDISTNYFIRKALHRSLKVKFVFTMVRGSVPPYYEKQGFLQLLRQAFQLLTNTQAYDYVLVITKAEILQSEEHVIQETVQFINSIKNEILNSISNLNEQDEISMNRGMLDLTERLLKQVNGRFTNICVFRTPDQDGRISESPIMMNAREKLRDAILHNSNYNPSVSHNFALHLSATSLMHLQTSLIPVMKETMRLNINGIFEFVLRNLEEYCNIMSEKLNLNDLLTELSKKMQTFESVVDKKMTFKTASNYILSLIKEVQSVSVVDKILSTIRIQNILEYFIIGEDNVIDFAIDVTKENEFLKRKIESLNSVKSLKTYISNYDQFAKIHSIVEQNKEILQYTSDEQTISLTNDNVEILLENSEIPHHILHETLFLKYINKYVEPIFQMKYECETDTLTISGSFILLSQISTTSCTGKKIVRIFAFDTVFVDTDLPFEDQQMQIIIIAPNWKIIGSRKFLLAGKVGEPPAPKPQGISCDGKPGNPGYPGGNFFGVGHNFEGTEHLEIVVHGGLGGKGQDGCNGADGVDGKVPYVYSWSNGGKFTNHDSVDYGSTVYSRDPKIYIGRRAVKASNGGNGGRGGITGISGTVSIVKLNSSQKNEYSVTVNPQKFNLEGRGGKGGKNPTNNGAKVHVDPKYCTGTQMSSSCRPLKITKTEYYPSVEQSRDGIDGSNEVNIRNPIAPDTLSSPSLQISSYKLKMMNRILKTEVFDDSALFMKYLSTSSQILQFNCDIKHIANEVVHFVETSRSLTIPTTTLETTIEILIENVERLGSHIPEKLALKIVLATLLSYKNLVTDQSVKSLVVNMSPYIDHASKIIRDVEIDSAKLVTHNLYANFSNDIDLLIGEANDMVDNSLDGEIKSLISDFDSSAGSLLNEIVTIEGNAESHKNDLEKKRFQLRENLAFSAVFGTLNTVASVLGVMSGAGAATSAVMQTWGGIVESQVVTNVDISNTEFKIPESVDQLLSNISNINQIETDDSKIILNEISQRIETLPDMFKNLKTVTTDFKKIHDGYEKEPYANLLSIVRNALKKDENSMNELLTLAEDSKPAIAPNSPGSLTPSESGSQNFPTSITIAPTVPETDAKPEKAKILKAMAVVNGIYVLANVAEVSMRYAVKYANDDYKLRVINNAINETDISIAKMNVFKKNVFRINNGILSNLHRDIDNFKKTAQQQTSSSLIFSKYLISNTIKEYKNAILNFVSGFKVAQNYLVTFTKLEELANLIIALFDKIQQYHDSKVLAQYIASINSDSIESIQFPEDATKQAIIKLRLALRSNSILDMATLIKNSYHQMIFPFAKMFDDHMPSIEPGQTYNSTYLAISKIQTIRGVINKIENTVSNSYHSHVHLADFNSESESSRPFFVWESRNFGTDICKLLSGEQIWLKSAVYNQNVRNAVKFDLIELKITSTNLQTQNDIRKILNYFTVEMTHTGSNYYKCNNTFFMIRSVPIKMRYSFEKNIQTGEPVDRNLNYKLLKKGEHILSPYTTWKLKLSTERTGLFYRLQDFCGKVDLEIVGSGSYVHEDSTVCSDDLTKYYQSYDDSLTNVYNYDNDEIKALLENYK